MLIYLAQASGLTITGFNLTANFITIMLFLIPTSFAIIRYGVRIVNRLTEVAGGLERNTIATEKGTAALQELQLTSAKHEIRLEIIEKQRAGK
jgi:hypothetical protein